MRRDLSFLKRPVYSAIVFFTTLAVLSLGYAAVVWTNMSDVISGGPLTSTAWNNLLGNVNYLSGQVAGLSAAPSSVPSGTVVDYAGTAAPSGWQLCYGQAVSRTTYAALFAAIGTTYGAGDGSTTFNLPDTRGRVVAGKDNMGGVTASRMTAGGSGINGTVLGASGGTETHLLTAVQSGLPSHSHNMSFYLNNGAGGPDQYALIQATQAGPSWYSSSAAGGTSASQAHQNTQPTVVMNKIIKE